MAKQPKLGSGGRFKKLVGELEKEGKDRQQAEAIAASIGRKKFGAKKFGKLAAKGKK